MSEGLQSDAYPMEEDGEQPVPVRWRAPLASIAERFAAGDFLLAKPVPSVRPMRANIAKQAREYVADYGCTLVLLPEETWETSVCIFSGEGRWDVLVDLWTAEEGRSDLVLLVYVHARGDDFEIEVRLLYVP
ncbi:MAG: hypothetical protein AAF411_04380 [Myxococcota bacterium]